MVTTGTPAKCEKGGEYCGTPTGWRRGGRCRRCRTAHNADLRKSRGLTSDQRAHFLRLLRAGQSVDQAAASAGVTVGSVNGSSINDGELRAALDGYPEPVQRVARLGDYLAALTRTGGDVALARQASGIGGSASLDKYRVSNPLFAAAEQAILEWIDQDYKRPHPQVPDELLDRAALLLEADPKPTLTSVARAIGVSPQSLRPASRRHERLRAALPPLRSKPSGREPVFTPEKDEQLRVLWPDKNVSVEEISKRLGLSRTTVAARASRLLLPPRSIARAGRRGIQNKLRAQANATSPDPEV